MVLLSVSEFMDRVRGELPCEFGAQFDRACAKVLAGALNGQAEVARAQSKSEKFHERALKAAETRRKNKEDAKFGAEVAAELAGEALYEDHGGQQ